MSELLEQPLGKIVADNIATYRVMEHHQIDYYCKGSRSLREAATEMGIDPNLLAGALEDAKGGGPYRDAVMDTMPLDELCDYIVERFHMKANADMHLIGLLLDRALELQGDILPEIKGIRDLFALSVAGMGFHQTKEEVTLFPFVKRMIEAHRDNEMLKADSNPMGDPPLKMLLHEHDMQDGALRKIASMTNEFTAPAEAGHIYRACMDLLKAFEVELHLHIHSENNILFPKAIALYGELTA